MWVLVLFVMALTLVVAAEGVAIWLLLGSDGRHHKKLEKAGGIFEAKVREFQMDKSKLDKVHHHMVSHDRRIILIEEELELRGRKHPYK